MEQLLKLIALVGMPGAGKSVAADFFRSKGIPVLRFGDQTDISLKELGLERNEKNERFVREKLRKDLGMAAYAIKIEPRIREAEKQSQVIVLDGLRSWEEYEVLKGKFPQLQLVCIYAQPAIRYDRLSRRPIRPIPKSESRGRDISELVGLNMGGPIAIADYLINNDGNEISFQNELEKAYKKLL